VSAAGSSASAASPPERASLNGPPGPRAPRGRRGATAHRHSDPFGAVTLASRAPGSVAQSVFEKFAMATVSIAAPKTATRASSTPMGTTHEPQVTGTSKTWRTAGVAGT
jgi:hypothetical protein